jgi:hypothetical protein
MSSPGQACLILWHQALLHMFRPFAIVVKWKRQRMQNLSSNKLSQHYLGLAAHAILQSIKQLSCCKVQAQHCRAIQIQHHGTSIAKARIWPWCSRRNYPWPMAIILLKSLSFVFSTLAHWSLVASRNRLKKHPLTLTGQHLDQSWSKAWPWFRVKRRMVFSGLLRYPSGPMSIKAGKTVWGLALFDSIGIPWRNFDSTKQKAKV